MYVLRTHQHKHTHRQRKRTPRARVLEGWPKCQPQSASGIVTFKRLTRAEPAAAAQHEQHQQRPSGSSSQSVELKTKHAQPTAPFLHTHTLTPPTADAPLASHPFHLQLAIFTQQPSRWASQVEEVWVELRWIDSLCVASQRLSECCPLWVCFDVSVCVCVWARSRVLHTLWRCWLLKIIKNQYLNDAYNQAAPSTQLESVFL